MAIDWLNTALKMFHFGYINIHLPSHHPCSIFSLSSHHNDYITFRSLVKLFYAPNLFCTILVLPVKGLFVRILFDLNIKTHGRVSATKRHTRQSQCVIYRKWKVPNFNPLHLGNYSTDFYQIYIFYALHIYDLTYQI